MTDGLRARLHAALTAPHALDALERLVVEVTADLRAENERLRGDAEELREMVAEVRRASDLYRSEMERRSIERTAAGLKERNRAEAAEAEVADLRTRLANVRAQVLDPAQMATEGPLIGRLKVASMLDRVLDADRADTTTTDGSGR